MKTRRFLSLVPIALVGLICGSQAEVSTEAATSSKCDRYAAPSGVDSGRGTLNRPYATPKKLVAALAPGQTGCLRGGTYSFSTLVLNEASLTLAPYRSEEVELRGEIKVRPDGAGSVIEGMKLNAVGDLGPRIYANSVVLRDNEITNNNTAICVLVGRYYSQPAPRGVVIKRNRIHHCGRLPATNHHHGIYLGEARNTIVRDNWIYMNADRGIQQYPAVQASLITGNVIDSNGQGVNFGGDDSGSCSNNNTVEGNVITNSNVRWNAYSGAQGPDCSGNVVRRNCVFASNVESDYNSNGGIEPNSRSFNASGNLVATPSFVDPSSGDYRLRSDSACLSHYEGTNTPPGP